jgi:hypothetical protein
MTLGFRLMAKNRQNRQNLIMLYFFALLGDQIFYLARNSFLKGNISLDLFPNVYFNASLYM